MNPSTTLLKQHFLFLVLLLSATVCMTTSAMPADLRGSLVVAGRGAERPVIEQLARAFEKAHLGTAIDVRWNRNLRITEVLASGEADLAVAGREETGLSATTIAWDGLAVIVNFSNPIKEATKQQVASLFSGKILNWSELDERGSGTIHVVTRPEDQNLMDGFEQSLGIEHANVRSAESIRSDQKVLSRVSGQLNAVSYLSLHAALEAVTYGMSVRTLVIDGFEPAPPTVQSGEYRLKRPVILLGRKPASPLMQAFIDFALSPAGQRLLGDMFVPLR